MNVHKKQTVSNRGEKISAKVQTIVAEILRDNYPDLNITLTGSESSGGLQFVKLFWQGDAALTPRLGEITRSVRFELAARMNQRYVPEIRFEYDDTLERAEKIEQLLKKVM